MNEDQFTDELVKRLDLHISDCIVETRKSLLYDLSIDEHGVAKLAVDKVSGDLGQRTADTQSQRTTRS
jgi:hypothetical protein